MKSKYIKNSQSEYKILSLKEEISIQEAILIKIRNQYDEAPENGKRMLGNLIIEFENFMGDLEEELEIEKENTRVMRAR